MADEIAVLYQEWESLTEALGMTGGIEGAGSAGDRGDRGVRSPLDAPRGDIYSLHIRDKTEGVGTAKRVGKPERGAP